MSEASPAAKSVDKSLVPKPRDSSTLIIVDTTSGEPRVLMGQKIVAGETVLAEIGQQPLIEGISQ